MVINAGSVIVDGDSSAATGDIYINGGGTLVGNGKIGGSISPGNSPGTLSTGSQIWFDGGTTCSKSTTLLEPQAQTPAGISL